MLLYFLHSDLPKIFFLGIGDFKMLPSFETHHIDGLPLSIFELEKCTFINGSEIDWYHYQGANPAPTCIVWHQTITKTPIRWNVTSEPSGGGGYPQKSQNFSNSLFFRVVRLGLGVRAELGIRINLLLSWPIRLHWWLLVIWCGLLGRLINKCRDTNCHRLKSCCTTLETFVNFRNIALIR